MSDFWKNKSVVGRRPSAGWLVGGKMGNLARSDLIRARHYNQLQFNIPGLPAYLPPPSSSCSLRRQNVLIKNRPRLSLILQFDCQTPFLSGLRIWRFEERAQVGTDGGSIISMLLHLPCLLIERPAFN